MQTAEYIVFPVALQPQIEESISSPSASISIKSPEKQACNLPKFDFESLREKMQRERLEKQKQMELWLESRKTHPDIQFKFAMSLPIGMCHTKYDEFASHIIKIGDSNIYLGSVDHIHNEFTTRAPFDYMKHKGINSIVCAMKEKSVDLEKSEIPNLTFMQVPIDDKESEKIEDWFEPFYLFMLQQIQDNKNIFIHCQMGISRSATLLASFLMKHYNMGEQEALSLLRTKRPQVSPNMSFHFKLKKYEAKLKSEIKE